MPELEVNSHHFEGVVKGGSNLIVSGKAIDGTFELMEIDTSPSNGQQAFVIGSQWHQEFEDHNHNGHRLFWALVNRVVDPDLVFEPAA
jgi:gamma-glutamyl-gamma-aminobutyrate hydrolase PuuD